VSYAIAAVALERARLAGSGDTLLKGSIGLQALDNTGRVGLYAHVASDGGRRHGLFIVSPDGAEEVLAAPVDVEGYSEMEFGRLNINDAAQGVFVTARSVPTEPYVETLWRYSDGEVRALVESAEQFDGVLLARSHAMTYWPTINARGDVAVALAEPNNGPRALYIFGDQRFRRVYGTFDPGPSGGQLNGPFVTLHTPWIIDTGEVLTYSALIGGRWGRESGLYAFGAGETVRVASMERIEGTNLRGRRGFWTPGSMNASRQVAFQTALGGEVYRIGVFVSDGDGYRPVAIGGKRAPGGGRFDFTKRGEDPWYFYPVINDSGDTAFWARVRVGDRAPVEAIFVASEGEVRRVVAVGDPLPSGGTVQGLAGFSLNDRGQVAFYAVGEGLFLASPHEARITP
jgi:hypothetical protein